MSTARARGTKAGRRTRLLLETDGASRGNPGPAPIGVVALDAERGEVAALGRRLGATTNNVAEYQAVIEALKMAQRTGANSVDLHADSELLVRQLEGSYRVKAQNLKPLYEEAQDLLRSFASYTLTHIPRERNVLADRIANRALDLPTPREHR